MRLKLLFITLIFIIFTAVPVMVFAQNQLQDPDFEGTGAGPWIPMNETAYTINFDETDNPYQGSQCLRIQADTPGPWSGGTAVQSVAVSGGQEFQATIWLRIPAAIQAQAYLEVVYRNAADNEVGKQQSTKYENTTLNWTELSCFTNSVPADAVKADIIAVLLPTTENVTGSIFFDTGYAGLPDYPYVDGLDVTVCLQLPELAVEILDESYDFGKVELGSVNQSSTFVIVTNVGTPATYALNLLNPAAWTASQTAAGNEAYVLNAAFNSDSSITWNMADHALSDTPVICSLSKFAGNENGVNVPAAAIRHLWLQFNAPTDSIVDTVQTIKILVTAQAP